MKTITVIITMIVTERRNMLFLKNQMGRLIDKQVVGYSINNIQCGIKLGKSLFGKSNHNLSYLKLFSPIKTKRLANVYF